MSDETPQQRVRRRVGRRPTDDNLPSQAEPAGSKEVAEQHADDPREQKAAEWGIAALFLFAAAMAIFFVVAYVTVPLSDNMGQMSNYALGGSLTLALGAVGAALVLWAKTLLPKQKAVQERHDFNSPPADQAESEATFFQGIDDLGLGRFKILRRSLIAALGLLPIPAVMLARDLGPLPGKSLEPEGAITAWRKNDRLVDSVTKLPYKLGDIEIGGIATVMPEGFEDINDEELAPTILIRFAPGEIQSAKELKWSADDHVAYSKVCTHAGCPISLYEQQTHNLLCPCHQSTFDMSRDAKVIFGPAARPLPQLQIYVDSEGYFRASGPYSQPVGPSFWERR